MDSGSHKSSIRLGCPVQRLTATVNSHLPIALDNQPANLCTSLVPSLYSPAFFRTYICTVEPLLKDTLK